MDAFNVTQLKAVVTSYNIKKKQKKTHTVQPKEFDHGGLFRAYLHLLYVNKCTQLFEMVLIHICGML